MMCYPRDDSLRAGDQSRPSSKGQKLLAVGRAGLESLGGTVPYSRARVCGA